MWCLALTAWEHGMLKMKMSPEQMLAASLVACWLLGALTLLINGV
ncbi:hypothetical protein U91I_02069 [alpha proteobacterium U9-1i]|nr:hypothetical protein U91I_02069 [alpha proteobacterium U9-1i]